jgi:hypothetical protein
MVRQQQFFPFHEYKSNVYAYSCRNETGDFSTLFRDLPSKSFLHTTELINVEHPKGTLICA